MMRRTLTTVTALSVLCGCVQTNSFGSYSSVSTVRYGAGEVVTTTRQDYWQDQHQQNPGWQARISPLGSSVSISAEPAPPPVNVIVVPAQAPCYNAPYIQRGVILPEQYPCR